MKTSSTNLPILLVSFGILIFFLAGCIFQTSTTTLISTSTPTPEVTSHVIRSYDDQAVLVTIPAGEFNMGSNSPDAEVDQTPEHKVSVAGFQIYSHEVTNAMYAKCVSNRVCVSPGLAGTALMRQFIDPAYGDYPVIGVDWNMVTDYCEFVGGRLPTEAEWEYAASGGIDNIYPWGNEMPTCDFLNMKACINPGRTAAGGSYPDGKTDSGIYDMGGNAWEWVYDWYAADTYANSTAANPAGPSTGTYKIVRGGGFMTSPEHVETITRQSANPIQGFNDVGFRCVKNGEALPASIALPPGEHSPTTPDGGVEDTPDTPPELGLVSLSEVGFDCVNPSTHTMNLSFKVHFGVAVSPLVVSAYISSLYGDGSLEYCMIWPLGEGTYGVVCPLEVPSGIDEADLPVWVDAEVSVKYNDPGITTTFVIPMEIFSCAPEPLEYLSDASARISCPDSEGLVRVSIEQSHSAAPDQVSFVWNGITLDGYCTDIYADSIMCTNVPDPGGESLMMLVRYPGSDTIYTYPFSATREECATVEHVFTGEVNCLPRGEYGLAVSVTPHPSDPWKIIGLNVDVDSGDPLLADTISVAFSTLPPPGEDIRYQVCIHDSGTGTDECTEYSTPQPDCPGPSTGDLLMLTAYGCDPDTNHFFAQFTHTLGVPDFSFLTVANNTSPMSCIDLGGVDHSLYCTSSMSPLINQVVFQYTDPAHLMNNTWTIAVEPCPAPVPDCSSFHDGPSCAAHGCDWTGKILTDPGGHCE